MFGCCTEVEATKNNPTNSTGCCVNRIAGRALTDVSVGEGISGSGGVMKSDIAKAK